MRQRGAQYASSTRPVAASDVSGLNIAAGPAIMPAARVAIVDARRIPGGVE
jgi:hypothetical protein